MRQLLPKVHDPLCLDKSWRAMNGVCINIFKWRVRRKLGEAERAGPSRDCRD